MKNKKLQKNLRTFCYRILRWQKISGAVNASAGFTLVETLVAVSILMMSVTGPLYYASESLKAATYARDQITAFYLAQDAFEQIRKIRDDNIYGAGAWSENLTGCEDVSCRVTDANGNLYKIDSGTDYFLYKSTTGFYSHKSSDTKTLFERKVTISPNDSLQTPAVWTDATEMKVTVTIIWNSRGVDRTFQAYELLRNLK